MKTRQSPHEEEGVTLSPSPRTTEPPPPCLWVYVYVWFGKCMRCGTRTRLFTQISQQVESKRPLVFVTCPASYPAVTPSRVADGQKKERHRHETALCCSVRMFPVVYTPFISSTHAKILVEKRPQGLRFTVHYFTLTQRHYVPKYLLAPYYWRRFPHCHRALILPVNSRQPRVRFPVHDEAVLHGAHQAQGSGSCARIRMADLE